MPNHHRYGCRCTTCNAGDTLHPKAKKRLQKSIDAENASQQPPPSTAVQKKPAAKK